MNPPDSRQIVTMSDPDRVVWKDCGITKGELAAYIEAVASLLIRHGAGRPVTVVVFPRGLSGPSYYRRNRPGDAPAWLGGVRDEPRPGAVTAQLLSIEKPADLLWLVKRGAIEFHFWMARVPNLDRPDQLVFDLDPGDDAVWQQVLNTALIVRGELAALGLRAVAKTSGGRGLHVYVPIAPGPSFGEVRAWVKAFALGLAARYPGLISAEGGATHLGHLVTIDYAQNSVGKSMAAPYTPRARPGAPVSAPLAWADVEAGVQSDRFTIRTLHDRLAQHGDLFKDALAADQTLPPLDPN
ncbi:MAG: non-homologous end-joining DNA ligase [Dehalococcoidia bacterium]